MVTYAGDQKGDRKRVTVKVPEKVTENQARIIAEISKNPHITGKKLAALIGISERKIKANIFKLKQKKLLKRIGSDRGGHWEIPKKA